MPKKGKATQRWRIVRNSRHPNGAVLFLPAPGLAIGLEKSEGY